MTRIGLLSLAHIHAESYLPILQAMPEVQVIGVTDEDPERGPRIAGQHGVTLYPSPKALLAEQLDAVIITSENLRRRPLVELAAQAGCQILCEKQIATTLEDAEAMRAACQAAGVSFMTAFPMRFDATISAVRHDMQTGRYGRVYAVNGINHSENPSGHRAWFADPTLAGGGAVMDHSPHLVDLLRWFLQAEVETVQAEITDPLQAGIDTAGLINLRFTDGAVATLDSSWSRPTTYPRWGHLKFNLITERGLVVVDAFAEHLDAYVQHAARTTEWIGYAPDANQAMLKEFIRATQEGRQPSVTWQDGYEALRVALAAYQSAREERAVRVA